MKLKDMNCLERFNYWIGREYKSVWESGDYEQAFELCNRLRVRDNKYNKPDSKLSPAEPYSRDKFWEGYTYRNIFAVEWKTAKNEFLNLVFGWW